MNNGFILISRKIFNSDIWSKPPLYLKVWLYLLGRAQYQQYKGLQRGQLITSIPEIQEACTYFAGYRKEKPTKKKIADILSYLRNPYGGNGEGNAKDPMIVTTKVTHGMLVTICNFNVYQDPKYYEGNGDGNNEKSTKASRKPRQRPNINEEDIKRIIPPYPLTELSFRPELENQILLWLQYKAEKNDAYKSTGFKTLLGKIKRNTDNYGESAVMSLIEEGMANNWKGIAWNRLTVSKKVKPEVEIIWR